MNLAASLGCDWPPGGFVPPGGCGLTVKNCLAGGRGARLRIFFDFRVVIHPMTETVGDAFFPPPSSSSSRRHVSPITTANNTLSSAFASVSASSSSLDNAGMATNSIKLLTGNSHPDLAKAVADRLVWRYLACAAALSCSLVLCCHGSVV